MPNFSVEFAIATSMILGLFLAFFNFGGVFSLALVGFVAVYLTRDEEADYKVGALAGGLLCFLYFVICLFTPPVLPYQLPSPLVLGVGYAFDGLFTLILGLVVGLLIYGFMGGIGGYFASKLFKSHEKPKTPKKPKTTRKIIKRKEKPQRRTLYRKYD
jgi:hypothetical protein